MNVVHTSLSMRRLRRQPVILTSFVGMALEPLQRSSFVAAAAAFSSLCRESVVCLSSLRDTETFPKSSVISACASPVN